MSSKSGEDEQQIGTKTEESKSISASASASATSKNNEEENEEERATNNDSSNSNGNGNSNSNDLIIDKGFPALNTFRVENAVDKDPIPRYPFASFPSALTIHQSQMSNIVHDCELTFTARTKEESDAYSSGATFFVPASIQPRCALEDMAMTIFRAHTKNLLPGKHYDPERSGAEWWTLVLDTAAGDGSDENVEDDKPKGKKDESGDGDDDDDDDEEEDDEVGMHFDADYGLEQQLPNWMLHPRVATVTYLTNVGVPTLILDKKSPPPTDVEKKSLNGNIKTGWISCPVAGKHIAFDGRLLHGAPGTFFPAISSCSNSGAGLKEANGDNSGNDNGNDHERASKRRKVESGVASAVVNTESGGESSMLTKRITFMVNIWLNHCPIDAELIDEDLITQLKTDWEDKESGSNLKGDESYVEPLKFSIDDTVDKPHKNEYMIKDLLPAEKMSQYAGSEETVICNREVTMNFCPTMEACHSIVQQANGCEGKSMQVRFQDTALNLVVGEEVLDSDEED